MPFPRLQSWSSAGVSAKQACPPLPTRGFEYICFQAVKTKAFLLSTSVAQRTLHFILNRLKINLKWAGSSPASQRKLNRLRTQKIQTRSQVDGSQGPDTDRPCADPGRPPGRPLHPPEVNAPPSGRRGHRVLPQALPRFSAGPPPPPRAPSPSRAPRGQRPRRWRGPGHPPIVRGVRAARAPPPLAAPRTRRSFRTRKRPAQGKVTPGLRLLAFVVRARASPRTARRLRRPGSRRAWRSPNRVSDGVSLASRALRASLPGGGSALVSG